MCLETDKIHMSTYKNHASHEEASLEMKGNFLKVSWPLARGVSSSLAYRAHVSMTN